MAEGKPAFDPDAASKKGATNMPPVVIDTADPIEEQAPDAAPPAHPLSADSMTSPDAPPKPMLPGGTATPRAITASKPVLPAPKPVPDKSSTPPRPAAPQPSLPISMIIRPDSASAASKAALFPGEAEESFESALARVEHARARNSLASRIWAGIREFIPIGPRGSRETIDLQRNVAFDGFRNDLFEDKRERDRRYGTVYTVSEEVNAFLVRLELPRRTPKSSLKQTWELPDEMPDYACTLTLTDNVLSIRASLPDEAWRRLSYVSSSFPSDFQTRIEFPTPVVSYKHRLRNKELEIIVNKKASVGVGLARKSRW